jgi:hypothetical protein
MEASLIAPCGMNCAICRGHLLRKKPCAGCAGSNINKPEGCKTCMVTICVKRQASQSGFCYECKSYPCLRIKQLDKRYKAKYHMSMMENLAMIKEQGMKAFLKKEEVKWKCPECGGIISCHTGVCHNCAPKNRGVPGKRYRRIR